MAAGSKSEPTGVRTPQTFDTDSEAKLWQRVIGSNITGEEGVRIFSPDAAEQPRSVIGRVYRNIVLDLAQGASEDRALQRALDLINDDDQLVSLAPEFTQNDNAIDRLIARIKGENSPHSKASALARVRKIESFQPKNLRLFIRMAQQRLDREPRFQ